MRGAFPERQPRISIGRVRNEELDRGVFWRCLGGLRQKNSAMVRASKKPAERELSLDNLAFPLFPWFVHGAPPLDSNIGRRQQGCTFCWPGSESTEASGLGATSENRG